MLTWLAAVVAAGLVGATARAARRRADRRAAAGGRGLRPAAPRDAVRAAPGPAPRERPAFLPAVAQGQPAVVEQIYDPCLKLSLRALAEQPPPDVLVWPDGCRCRWATAPTATSGIRPRARPGLHAARRPDVDGQGPRAAAAERAAARARHCLAAGARGRPAPALLEPGPGARAGRQARGLPRQGAAGARGSRSLSGIGCPRARAARRRARARPRACPVRWGCRDRSPHADGGWRAVWRHHLLRERLWPPLSGERGSGGLLPPQPQQ
jgi:hypothetical protein